MSQVEAGLKEPDRFLGQNLDDVLKSIFEAMLPPLPYWAVRPGYAHNREDGVPCINS